MKIKRWSKTISFVVAGLLATSLVVAGCGSGQWSGPSQTTVQPTTTPAPLPTYSLDETSMTDFVIKDFGVVHSQVNEDANEYLIYGNVPISPPAANLPRELAALLGRWEGYSYGPPVKKDWKFVLVIQEITAQSGKALLWTGTNLQYPDWVKEIQFRVVPGAMPSIEWQYDLDGKNTFTFTYDSDKNLLQGFLKSAAYNSHPWGPISTS